MYNRTSPYQAISSPSKIDQWCKPKPAAKLVLTLVRRSPLMLKERAKLVLTLVRRSPLMLKERVGGSMKIYFENQPNKYHLSHCHTPPLSPSILEGELTHSCLTILIVTIET